MNQQQQARLQWRYGTELYFIFLFASKLYIVFHSVSFIDFPVSFAQPNECCFVVIRALFWFYIVPSSCLALSSIHCIFTIHLMTRFSAFYFRKMLFVARPSVLMLLRIFCSPFDSFSRLFRSIAHFLCFLCSFQLNRKTEKLFYCIDFGRYGRWVTRRIAVLTIVTIWLLAALVSFVPISFSLHRPDQPLVFEDNGRQYLTCALDLTPTYAVVSSCISFYVPCIVMIGIYCRYIFTFRFLSFFSWAFFVVADFNYFNHHL